MQRLQRDAHVFYLIFKHPRTPWYARVVAACIAGYVFSPIQVIPNFIPVIGSLDDILVLYVGSMVLQKITPADVLVECRELADAAQMRRKAKTTGAASVVVPVVVVTVWILAAITVSALMATYIYR
ncbi:MAG: YkvA family protein [Candidatus Sulfotelmatobacter sp.]